MLSVDADMSPGNQRPLWSSTGEASAELDHSQITSTSTVTVWAALSLRSGAVEVS
jgi:hypothetical protein